MIDQSAYRTYLAQIDQNVDFPVENLSLEDRCDELRLARTLETNGKDLGALGLEDATKPLVYDLCESVRMRSWLDATDSDWPGSRDRPALRILRWRPLHRGLQERRRRQLVQV